MMLSGERDLVERKGNYNKICISDYLLAPLENSFSNGVKSVAKERLGFGDGDYPLFVSLCLSASVVDVIPGFSLDFFEIL